LEYFILRGSNNFVFEGNKFNSNWICRDFKANFRADFVENLWKNSAKIGVGYVGE